MKKLLIYCLFFLSTAILGKLYAEGPFRFAALERMTARGKIVFIVSGENNYPFLFRQNNSWQGIERNRLSALADDLGLPWEILVCKDPSECFSALENGRGDVLAGGIKRNVKDARFLAYSESIVRGRLFLLYDRLRLAETKEERLVLDPVKMLEGSKEFDLGLSRGSSGGFFVQREYNHSKVKFFNTNKDAVDSLRRGEIRLCLSDEWEYRNRFLRNAREALFVGSVPLPAYDDYCFAVSWKDRDFLEIVNHSFSSTAAETAAEDGVRKTYYSWR